MRQVLALALLLMFAGSARADEPVPARRIGVSWRDRVPRVSVSVVDLLNSATRRKLESGLPQTILFRVYAYPARGERPITLAAISCRVVYDLWQEVFRIERTAPEGSTVERVRSLADVASRCADARSLPVGVAADYTPRSGHPVYFAVLVELNTVSRQTVERVRRWLAHRSGGLAGDAFYGSFVSLFVNRQIGQAERTVRFRSQTTTVP